MRLAARKGLAFSSRRDGRSRMTVGVTFGHPEDCVLCVIMLIRTPRVNRLASSREIACSRSCSFHQREIRASSRSRQRERERERERERNDDANEARSRASPAGRNVQDRACTLHNFIVRVCTPVIKMSTSRDSQDSAPFLRLRRCAGRGFHGLFPRVDEKPADAGIRASASRKKIDRVEFHERLT